jgi:hypothetical protein
MSEKDIAREIIKRTPEDERPMFKRFYLSPDAFDLSVRRAGQNQIAQLLGNELRAGGLPYPVKADNSRVSGWKLMFNMLQETKRHGARGNEDIWLISANCPYLIAAIPVLMRDPRNLEDVLKTDVGGPKIEQDMGDCGRYGLKSMLRPGQQPDSEAMEEVLSEIPDMTRRHVTHLQMSAAIKKKHEPIVRPGDWRRRLEEQ